MSRFLGISSKPRILCNICATCSLLAVPRPVMDCLIRRGAYSVTGMSRDNPAAIATPCARPSFNMDCTFLPKNGASKAISSGLKVSINSMVRSKILRNFT